MDVRAILVLSLLAACGGSDDGFPRGCELEGDERITDGGFDRGLRCWQFVGEGEAEDANQSPTEVPSAQVTPTDLIDLYATRLVSTPVTTTNNEPMTISFSARSEEPRPMTVVIGTFDPEGEDTSEEARIAYEQRVSLNPNWQEFSYEFSSGGTLPEGTGRLQFLVGHQSGLTVWIDDVSLRGRPVEE